MKYICTSYIVVLRNTLLSPTTDPLAIYGRLPFAFSFDKIMRVESLEESTSYSFDWLDWF